tara:strand:+ start:349 stop:621 length:273 start_codon:yes stop_codon:yes gene_type:complete
MAYKMNNKTSNGTVTKNGLSKTGVITKTKGSGKSGTTIFGMSPIKFGKTIMKTAAQRAGGSFVAPILRPLSKKIRSMITKAKSKRTKTKK